MRLELVDGVADVAQDPDGQPWVRGEGGCWVAVCPGCGEPECEGECDPTYTPERAWRELEANTDTEGAGA